MANTSQPISRRPCAPLSSDTPIPSTAVSDQMIFKFSMALNVSTLALRPNQDSMPIPNRAAATRRVAMGSTVCQPSQPRNFTGNSIIGMAKSTSTIQWIANHVDNALGGDCIWDCIFYLLLDLESSLPGVDFLGGLFKEVAR